MVRYSKPVIVFVWQSHVCMLGPSKVPFIGRLLPFRVPLLVNKFASCLTPIYLHYVHTCSFEPLEMCYKLKGWSFSQAPQSQLQPASRSAQGVKDCFWCRSSSQGQFSNSVTAVKMFTFCGAYCTQCSHMCAVKQSRSHLRCGQVVKQQKRQSKFFDAGRSCDYSAYGSDHPLKLYGIATSPARLYHNVIALGNRHADFDQTTIRLSVMKYKVVMGNITQVCCPLNCCKCTVMCNNARGNKGALHGNSDFSVCKRPIVFSHSSTKQIQCT